MINFLKLPLGIALCLLVVQFEGINANTDNPCTGSGFFALVDHTSEFYACDETPTGGYSVRYLQCQTGLVFSAQLGKCVEQLPLPAEEIISPEVRDDGNIENPTIPPTNLDESTSTVVSTEQTTTKPAESTSTTEDKESSSTTAVTEDGESSSSSSVVTEDGESSSTSAVTEDGESSSTASGESSTSAVTEDGESSSTSAVTEDGESSSTSAGESSTSAVTQDGESSSTSAVTDGDDSSSSSSVVTDAPDSSSTASDAVTKTTEEDNICATSGFLPKSGNCSQYVYCQDKGDYLKPYNFDCPQAMQFDPTCNYCIKGYDCTKA
ncbi:uncharacterized protein Muc18B [Drosophila tropicalis]|uniref:uncharacterized protein Muc18B n=1 Tax=Drosophila tropicalis TaxID=46794 RepID=UPI0035ABF2E6